MKYCSVNLYVIFLLLLLTLGPDVSAQSDSTSVLEAGLNHRYTLVEDRENRTSTRLRIGSKSDDLSYLFRADYATRFGSSGSYLGADLYPEISRKSYMWLSGGFSTGKNLVYPEWDLKSVFYTSLTDKVVGGPGFRFVRLSTKSAYIYSLNFNVYTSSGLFLIKPYLQDTGNKKTASASLRYRHYFNNPGEYWELSAAYGRNPENSIFTDEINNSFSSISGGAKVMKALSDHIWLNGGISLRNYTFSSGTEQLLLSVNSGITLKFQN